MSRALRRRLDRLSRTAASVRGGYVCNPRPGESAADALRRHAAEHPGVRAVALLPPVMTDDEWAAAYCPKP